MPNVWFQKIFIYPPCGWSLEIPRGQGISQAKIFKGKYEAKLEFLEGWCFKVKNVHGGVWIFSGTTQWRKIQ